MTDRRVRFRSYCYGCRLGNRWRKPLGQRRAEVDRGLCIWPEHRFDWEYIVEQGGVRIFTRGNFSTRDRAVASAQRTWFKLAVALDGAA